MNNKADYIDNDIAQFSSLSRIGLSNSDFVSNDLATNLNTIMDAAENTFEPSYRIWEYTCVYESTHPLVASMNAAINAQFGSTWNTYIDFWMKKISPLHMKVYMFLQGADAHKYAYLLTYRKSNNSYHITALSGHRSAPFGSYIGNGSSTKRTISVGINAGNTISIWSNNGSAFINKAGGIAKSGSTTKGLSASAINFSKGTLTIASTDSLVNESDITYYFEVL